MMTRKEWFIEAKELLFIALCSIPYAFVVNQVLVPHAIIGGGLSGLCEIVYFLSNGAIPIWISNLTFNTVLIVIAIVLLGWKACIRAIYGILCITLWFRLIPIAATPIISDPFMAVIIGGVLSGSGLGLIYANNGNTGGTDIVAMIVNRYKHVSMGRALFFVDLTIICSAWFLPQVTRVEQLLFALCLVFIETQAVDWILNRGRQSVQFFIFSQHYQEIADAIMTRLGRGVTFLESEGAYTRKENKLIMLIVRRSEASRIYHIVRDIDPNAFISETPTRSVTGLGFEPLQDKA